MRRISKHLKGILAAIVIVSQLFVTNVYATDINSIDTRSEVKPEEMEEIEKAAADAYHMEVYSNTWNEWPEGPKTYGEAGIIMDAESGAILYAKNIDGKSYPASITKILTLLIALENGKMDDTVTISEEAMECVRSGYAHIGLQLGEKISLEDALYALMLASANEAAQGIADSVGENSEWFFEEMNRRTKELGGNNSNFVNPNGMENPEHYTTARDMALITRELLLKHPEFEQICQTVQHVIDGTNLTSEQRVFQQKHQMFIEGSEYFNPNVIAGKTGYTDLAKNTLVTCAEKNGMKLICVVLKTHGRNVYTDTQKLLDYGFDNFEKIQIDTKETSKEIVGFEKEAYAVAPKGVTFEDLSLQIKRVEEDKNKAKAIYTYNDVVVGEFNVTVDESFENEKEEENEPASDTMSLKEIIKYVLIACTALLFILIIILIRVILKQRKRRKERERRRRMRKQREMESRRRRNR